MRKTAIVAVVLAVFFGPGLAYGSGKVKILSLDVNPYTSFVLGDERVYIRVLIRLEKNSDNRLLRLEWDSPDGEAGSSTRNLDGENSQAVFTGEDFLGRRGLNLSAGHYQVKVTLLRIVDGEEKVTFALATIQVVRGEEEDR